MEPYDSVHPSDHLRAVRTRWPLILLVAGLVTATALAVSLSGDKRYDATVKLLISGQEPINSLLNPSSTGSTNDPERDLNTGVEVIEAGGTAHAVRRVLGLRRSPDDLLDQVEAKASTSSDIVSLTARDRSPTLAADIANAFAEAYVDSRLSSARRRYRQAADLAVTQLSTLSEAERAAPEGQALQTRRRELQIAGALQTGGSEIIRRASVPRDPVRPRPRLSTALGLVLGLLLGTVAALALEFMDRRLKSEEAIESFFELPILGTIPPPSRRASSHDDHLQREAFGLLAANLRLAALGQRGKVLMITSSGPIEGKTSVTLGLARSFAMLGLRVIAIEADLRRPAFGRYVTLSPTPGLSAVISRESTMFGALVSIDAQTLAPVDGDESQDRISFRLLPVGELPADPQRVLSSPSMHSVLAVARSLADVVLIDTAPLGTVNDAAALLHLVDSTAIVVRLGATTKDAARRALRVLRNVDVSVTGLVITDADGGQTPGYYYGAEPGFEPAANQV